jgi:hypothetical protein
MEPQAVNEKKVPQTIREVKKLEYRQYFEKHKL